MTFRVRFAKYGVIKFVGHLDVMRYFQKVVRRSGLPVMYSQGFNPHQIMSFAQPLGVGLTSEAEFMEIELDESKLKEPYAEYVMKLLSENVTEGFAILEVKQLPPPVPNKKIESAMSLVYASDYMLSVKDGYDVGFTSQEELSEAYEKFLAQDSIMIHKKTKKSERDIDIRPYIESCSGDPKYAEEYDNGMRLFMRLPAGSELNIRPELVIEAFMQFTGHEYNVHAWQIHKLEILMRDAQ